MEPPTKATRNEGGVLRLPDGRLMGYAVYGKADGFPVLAIHGTPGSRKMLQPADELAQAKGLRLIAPDRPGYGLSSAHEGYTPTQWVADAKVLLDDLKVKRFGVIGVSGGGPFATAVAVLLPQRVQGLVLVSPVGLFDEQVRKNWSWRHHAFFNLLPRASILLKLLLPVVRFFVLHAPGIPLKIFIRSLGKSDRAVLAKQVYADQLLVAFHDGLAPGIKGVLADLRIFASVWQTPAQKALMPVTIWQGMDDRMVPSQGALRLADTFANSEIIILEKAGHFWIFEHMEEVLEPLLVAARI